jgi:hypothetical protein
MVPWSFSEKHRHFPQGDAMTRLAMARLALVFVGSAGLLLANENETRPAGKEDPSGVWRWSVLLGKYASGAPLIDDCELKLKLDGGKLTGTYYCDLRRSGQARQPQMTKAARERLRRTLEKPIQDAKIEGGEISFKIVTMTNGKSHVSHFTGRISGDTIQGKREQGQDVSTWNAKRAMN